MADLKREQKIALLQEHDTKNLSREEKIALLQKSDEAIAKSQEKPDIGQGKAALIGLEQGATLGLRPIVAGAGAALGSAVGKYQAGGGLGDILKAGKQGFSEGRSEAIEEQKTAHEQYPNTVRAADIGSGLLTMPFLPAANTVKKAAVLGAGLGTANAIGSAQSLPEAGLDIAGGAAIGAGASKVAQKIGQGLSAIAESNAFKAAGAMLKDFRAAFAKDPHKINDLGRTMLDNNLVKAGDTVNSIAEKSENLRRDTGKQIGKVYEKVLDKLTDPQVSNHLGPESVLEIQAAGFHPLEQASEMKSMIYNKFKGLPGSTNAINKANQVIDELAINGNHITPERALELKKYVGNMIDWSKKSKDLPMDQEALKEVTGFIKNKLQDQIGLLDKALGSNETKELLRLNKLYGNVDTISEIARDKALRNMASRPHSLQGIALDFVRNRVAPTEAAIANTVGQSLQKSANPIIVPAATTLIRSPSKLRKE